MGPHRKVKCLLRSEDLGSLKVASSQNRTTITVPSALRGRRRQLMVARRPSVFQILLFVAYAAAKHRSGL
jgi:hypothetical protein